MKTYRSQHEFQQSILRNQCSTLHMVTGVYYSTLMIQGFYSKLTQVHHSIHIPVACLSQKFDLDNHVVKRVMTLPSEKLHCHDAAEIRGTFHDDQQDRNLTAVIMQYRSRVRQASCFKTETNPNSFIH